MLVLSNSLIDKADEGSLKLATSLVKRLRNKHDNVRVIAFERNNSIADDYVELNKFHLSRRIVSILKKEEGTVLYIPFPAPMNAMALRIWLLSRIVRGSFKVMMIRQFSLSKAASVLLRQSKAEIVVFSKAAEVYYRSVVGDRVRYLKTGVDTQQYTPVDEMRKRELKTKYGFDTDTPLVLHVGHMKEGRNVAQLLKIDERFQVLLVISTLAKERQNAALREQLEKRSNIRIFDQYLPHIEEIYQMADVYLFPVQQEGHCIDVPLSCLEAAACGIPVITTAFGEMKEFNGRDGFTVVDDIDRVSLNDLIEQCLGDQGCCGRDAVKSYDWDCTVKRLICDF